MTLSVVLSGSESDGNGGGGGSSSVWDGPVSAWPPDHCRVLYCISKYAWQSTQRQTPETWVRQIALLVLLYEGIEQGVLAFEYAPNLTWISYERQTERRWLRISQQAKSVIDDLWEAQLVNGIKLSSIDFQPVTAYQVSTRGLAVVARLPAHIKSETARFIYPPPPHEHHLLKVHYDGEDFYLATAAGYSAVSGITKLEAVSYVSSPYLPTCLRSTNGFRVEPTCNQGRATESARGLAHHVTLKSAKETVVLANVCALVGEWMPFGANQIAALNERLGAMERCQGGLFSSMIDEQPTETFFKVPTGLTQVNILDFDLINFINFEAEIHQPEDDGVIQIENFGMHLNVSGALLYGVRIDAIMNRRASDIPSHLLARLLVDVHKDSSIIIRDLLSRYQLSVLDMLFMGKPRRRNKYNLIMASQLTPKLSAAKYLDKGDRENELKQLLGEIYECYDITREDVLFLGRDGCLFAGPSAGKFEALLTMFMGLNSREIFIRNFFVRTFVLDDTLATLRRMIRDYRHHPASLVLVKESLSEAARNIILLIECLQYLLESVEDLELPPIPPDAAGAKLFQSLSLMERKHSILLRCRDSIKLIERLRTQLDMLVAKFETVSRAQLLDVSRDFELHINRLILALHTRDRVRATLTVLRVLFAGQLTFDVIDRLSASASFHVATPSWLAEALVAPLLAPPMVFFIVNVTAFAVAVLLVEYALHRHTRHAEASIVVRALVNKRIHVPALRALLATKTMQMQAVDFQHAVPDRRTYLWTEGGFPCEAAETQIELLVDEKQQLLRSIRLQVACPIEESKPMQRRRQLLSGPRSLRRMSSSPSGLTENSLLDEFTKVLRAASVYVDSKRPLARLGSVMHIHEARAKEPVDRDARSRRRRLSSINIHPSELRPEGGRP